MIATIGTTTTITLVLTEEEAQILAGLVQNSQVPIEEEHEASKKLRYDIFNAIKENE